MPAPTVTTISPRTGGVTGGSSVTITGTDFTGATSVTIGGAAATSVVVVDATTITCKTPTGSEGVASVLVTNPSGTNGANALYIFVPKDARPLYVYLQGGRGDSPATETWNGLAPTEEITQEKSEFYRDIFGVSTTLLYPGSTTLARNPTSVPTLSGITFTTPVATAPSWSSGEIDGGITGTLGSTTSDEVGHEPPRQTDKAVTWLIFEDEAGTPYKFRKAQVIGWGNSPRN